MEIGRNDIILEKIELINLCSKGEKNKRYKMLEIFHFRLDLEVVWMLCREIGEDVYLCSLKSHGNRLQIKVKI